MSALDTRVITMPSMGDLDWAIENLAQSAADPFVARCRPRWEGTTLLAHPGGVARVYPVDIDNRTMALRCWISITERQEERYRHISRLLGRINVSCLVDVRYIAQGLTVGPVTYPVLCMDWVDGLNLSAYLDLKHQDSAAILRLSRCFSEAVRELHTHDISHGDLQDGNIRVAGEGEGMSMKLVDYDTLYTPAFGQWQSTPIALPAYQHPCRGHRMYQSPRDDHFSELVIYLSLRAIAEDPRLWKAGTELQLLFSPDDYIAPESSPTFARLMRMSPEIRRLTRTLQAFCAMADIRRLPPLEMVLEQSAPLLVSYFGFNTSPFDPHSRLDTVQLQTFAGTSPKQSPFEIVGASHPLPVAFQQYFNSATATGETREQPPSSSRAVQVPIGKVPSMPARRVFGAAVTLLVLLVFLYLFVL